MVTMLGAAVTEIETVEGFHPEPTTTNVLKRDTTPAGVIASGAKALDICPKS
jgi:hypothetical protein